MLGPECARGLPARSRERAQDLVHGDSPQHIQYSKKRREGVGEVGHLGKGDSGAGPQLPAHTIQYYETARFCAVLSRLLRAERVLGRGGTLAREILARGRSSQRAARTRARGRGRRELEGVPAGRGCPPTRRPPAVPGRGQPPISAAAAAAAAGACAGTRPLTAPRRPRCSTLPCPHRFQLLCFPMHCQTWRARHV